MIRVLYLKNWIQCGKIYISGIFCGKIFWTGTNNSWKISWTHCPTTIAPPCTLVQNEIVSFRNYFDAFKAIKALHFEPTHMSGIKSGLTFSGFFQFFYFTSNESRNHFLGEWDFFPNFYNFYNFWATALLDEVWT